MREFFSLSELFSIETSPSDIPEQALDNLAVGPISPSTRNTYQGRLDLYKSWVEDKDFQTFPATPKVVQLYVISEVKEGLALSTIRTSVCAIGHAHRKRGYEDPTASKRVKNTVRHIARISESPSRMCRPVRSEEVAQMVRALPGSPRYTGASGAGESLSARSKAQRLRGVRGRALLPVVFGGALRRSEAAGIKCAHVSFKEKGLELLIPASKGDQTRQGQKVCIRRAESKELCPVRGLKRWLRLASITEGPIFRPVWNGGNVPSSARGPISGATVNRTVKKAAAACSIDASGVSAHSLRYGHLITAAERGASLAELQRQARHSDPQTTSRYIQEANRMRTTTSRYLGL
jgi:integrase